MENITEKERNEKADLLRKEAMTPHGPNTISWRKTEFFQVRGYEIIEKIVDIFRYQQRVEMSAMQGKLEILLPSPFYIVRRNLKLCKKKLGESSAESKKSCNLERHGM